MKSPTKVLITGATGFIGRNLVKRLLSDGYLVSIVVRDTSDLRVFAEFIQVIRVVPYDERPEFLYRNLGQIDIAVHLATLFVAEHQSSDIIPLVDSNIRFSALIFEALSKCGRIPVVNVGTSWQHYQNEMYNPVSLYAATKQAALDILCFYTSSGRLKALDLNLNDTYGIGDPRRKLLSLFRQSICLEQPILFSLGEQRVNLLYIDDAIEALIVSMARIARDDAPDLSRYSVRGPETLKLRELANLYSDVNGVVLNIVWGGKPYRLRELMLPPEFNPALPDWAAKVGIRDGLERIKLAPHQPIRPSPRP